MKLLFVGYIIAVFLLGVYGIYYNKTDENGYFKVNWPFGLTLILFVISPIVAKMCGLI